MSFSYLCFSTACQSYGTQRGTCRVWVHPAIVLAFSPTGECVCVVVMQVLSKFASPLPITFYAVLQLLDYYG